MKDLSRERIAELRAMSMPGAGDSVLVPWHLYETLLDMASRAVSEETVRKLAEHLATRDSIWSRQVEATSALVDSVVSDLRPSAEALARSAGEGLLRSLGLDKETR